MKQELRIVKILNQSLIRNHKSLIVILASCFLLLASALSAFAQNTSNYDVTVSPVFFDLTANPGDTLSEKIRIRNNTGFPIPILLQVKGISGDNSGNLSLKEDNLNQAVEWIRFTEQKTVLKPLEWTTIPFTIVIPKEAGFGYYVAISFTQDKANPLTKTGASITGAAAVPILLNIRKEGAKAEAKILDFSVSKYIFEYLPIDFNANIQNTGNVHVKPHGSIFISASGGKNLTILDVNPGLGSVLPQTARKFQASWVEGFIVYKPIIENGQPKLDKSGKILQHLVINWDKLTSFRFGKYTATLLLVFDNGTKDVPLETSLSFWVIPYKVIIGTIIVFIILIIILRFLLNRYISRQVKKGMSAGL